MVDRFGWTFDQLDEQDEGRAVRAVSLLNMMELYSDVMNAVKSHKPDSVSPRHWEIYKLIHSANGDEA